MKLLRKVGSTSQVFQVFVRDSSSTTGAGLTGLTNASSGLTAYYHRDTDTTATAISLVTMTVGTFTSSGFKEIDATNMPGWYQFCPPNAAFNTGAVSVAFHLKGATNMAPLPIEVDLDAQVDATHWAGTAITASSLPVATAAGASGGLLIAGSNAATTFSGLTTGALSCTTITASGAVAFQSTFATTGTTTFNALTITNAFTVSGATTLTGAVTATNGSNAITGVTVAGYASGQAPLQPTVAGRTLDVTATGAAGIDWGNLENATTAHDLSGTTIATVQSIGSGGITTDSFETGAIDSAALGSTAVAEIATGVWQDAVAGDFTVASSIGKCLYTGNVVPGGTGGHFIAGTNAATIVTTSFTTTFTGNLTGSVASVSGAVGSVTGNVGGNVAGTVASIVSPGNVWDVVLASHLTAGSTGFALNAAGSAGDPWGTALPGAYGAGTAGHIVGTALPDIAPGSANGLLRGGTNTATTFATLTSTGALTAGSVVNNGVTDVAQTGDSFARIGALGAGLTALAPASTALSTGTWTNGLATNLATTNTTVAANLNAAVGSVPTAVWAAGTRTLTGFSFGVNVTEINSVTLTGTGVVSDPWGPA